MGRSPLGHVGRVVFDSVADAGPLRGLGHGPRVLLEVEKVTGTASRSAVCRVDRTCPTRPITRTRKPTSHHDRGESAAGADGCEDRAECKQSAAELLEERPPLTARHTPEPMSTMVRDSDYVAPKP